MSVSSPLRCVCSVLLFDSSSPLSLCEAMITDKKPLLSVSLVCYNRLLHYSYDPMNTDGVVWVLNSLALWRVAQQIWERGE